VNGKASADPLRGWLGRAGLWKCTTEGNESRCRFDLPPEAVLPEDDGYDEAAPAAWEAALAWAMATADGRTPEGWHAPLLEDLGQPTTEIIVQHDRFVRHGRLVRSDHALTLRVPILGRPRTDLPESRKEYLDELLIDAQNRWRMVRVGLDSPDASVEAEVNLSGAPHAVMETLVRTAKDALCWFVIWLVGSVDLLADPAVASEALRVRPSGLSRERREHEHGEPRGYA